MQNPDRILERLTALHPKKIDLSLGRMERLLEALNHPEDKLPPVFHVAGTNGKGSTVAFLRAMLEAAGYRVHVYTSPHLVHFTERIRLAGTLIAPDHLADILERCERANGTAPITFFEITTAAAFLAFAEKPADALILEVGLGGRLDATNMIRSPLVTAVSPVSLDHHEFLGSDLAAIAREKAGIARRGRPLVTAPQPPMALRAIETVVAETGAQLLRHGPDWTVMEDGAEDGTEDGEDHGQKFHYRDGYGELNLPPPHLPGAHQLINAGLAIACLRHQSSLPIPVAAIKAGLGQVKWPARFEDISHAPGLKGRIAPPARVWLDGGHNPAAGVALAPLLANRGGAFTLIVGMMANKDAAGYLAPLAPHVEQIIAVPIPGHACHDATHLVAAAEALGIKATAAPNVMTALSNTMGAARTLIGGSLYLAGQVLADVGLVPD